MAPASADAKFTDIYRQCYDDVLAYCARRVDQVEADDAANEVFEVLWRKLDEVDEARALPWLYGVAGRILMHRWRSKARWRRLVDRAGGLRSVPTVATDDVVVLRDQERMVLDALSRLKPADQEILRLAAWEELTAPESALVLGCSVAAAEQRLHRAKKRLASRLSASSYDWGLAPLPGEGSSR